MNCHANKNVFIPEKKTLASGLEELFSVASGTFLESSLNYKCS